MHESAYNRDAVVAYARKWAMNRNPQYYDFEKIGGDCTNFASQCIFAGAGKMNFTKVTGWYYRSVHDRTASWSGVDFLYKFLANNRSVGPYGHLVSQGEVQPGDIVQLGRFTGEFYHTPVITAVTPVILVAAHSFDTVDKPLAAYSYEVVRFIHIDGVKYW